MSISFKTLTAAALIAAAAANTAAASGDLTTLYDGAFARVPVDAKAGGRTVAEHCQLHGGETWDDARAHLVLKQNATTAEVTVTLENGRPDTLYTIWLMLAGKTASGESFGGNPLMKTGATALVPSTALPEAIEIMKNPNSEAANGFTTDAAGNGSVTVALDFPIVGGAYPFQRYAGFDANDPAYTREAPQAVPVAITGKSAGAPFTLRLASHCGDNLHNGLVAGQHEAWFNWLAE